MPSPRSDGLWITATQARETLRRFACDQHAKPFFDDRSSITDTSQLPRLFDQALIGGWKPALRVRIN